MNTCETSCTACASTRCITEQACHVPLAELKPVTRPIFTQARGVRLPGSREGWGRVVMAGTGVAGFAFILGACGRAWGWW